MATSSYPARTRQNVRDSDATLIVAYGPPEGGTALTVEICLEEGKPHVIIDATQQDARAAAATVAQFIREHHITTLNVAGPRASKQPKIVAYTYEVVATVLRDLSSNDAH